MCIQVYSCYYRLLHGLCPPPPPTRGQCRPTRTRNRSRSHRRPNQANNGQRRPTTGVDSQRGIRRDNEDLRQDDGGPDDATRCLGPMVCFFITYFIVLLTFIGLTKANEGQRGMTRANEGQLTQQQTHPRRKRESVELNYFTKRRMFLAREHSSFTIFFIVDKYIYILCTCTLCSTQKITAKIRCACTPY
jgi:hypothetical protein